MKPNDPITFYTESYYDKRDKKVHWCGKTKSGEYKGQSKDGNILFVKIYGKKKPVQIKKEQVKK